VGKKMLEVFIINIYVLRRFAMQISTVFELKTPSCLQNQKTEQESFTSFPLFMLGFF